MDLLIFDAKSGGDYCSPDLPSCSVRARFFGGAVVVPDSQESAILQTQGVFGHEIGERQDRVLNRIFRLEPTERGQQPKPPPHPWTEKHPRHLHLRLSPEETVYLAVENDVLQVYDRDSRLSRDDIWRRAVTLGDVKRIAVYCRLRELGWTVRSGLPYGCHYLIYREGPEAFHASAAVRIDEECEPREFVALNRALSNVKKAAISAFVYIPSHVDLSLPSCLSSIDVKLTTSATFFLEKHTYEKTISSR